MASSQRISEQIPVRDVGTLDYERCAAPHNEIVKRRQLGCGGVSDDSD